MEMLTSTAPLQILGDDGNAQHSTDGRAKLPTVHGLDPDIIEARSHEN